MVPTQIKIHNFDDYVCAIQNLCDVCMCKSSVHFTYYTIWYYCIVIIEIKGAYQKHHKIILCNESIFLYIPVLLYLFLQIYNFTVQVLKVCRTPALSQGQGSEDLQDFVVHKIFAGVGKYV